MYTVEYMGRNVTQPIQPLPGATFQLIYKTTFKIAIKFNKLQTNQFISASILRFKFTYRRVFAVLVTLYFQMQI